jgi:hypothetical protein
MSGLRKVKVRKLVMTEAVNPMQIKQPTSPLYKSAARKRIRRASAATNMVEARRPK